MPRARRWSSKFALLSVKWSIMARSCLCSAPRHPYHRAKLPLKPIEPLVEIRPSIHYDFELASSGHPHPPGTLWPQRYHQRLTRNAEYVGNCKDALNLFQCHCCQQRNCSVDAAVASIEQGVEKRLPMDLCNTLRESWLFPVRFAARGLISSLRH